MNRRKETARSERRDGFVALLTGPVIWFAFFLAAYAITGIGCATGASEGGGLGLLRVLVLLAALAAAVAVAFAGVRMAHRWREAAAPSGEGERERRRFADMGGALLCAAAFVGIVWLATGVVIHPLC